LISFDKKSFADKQRGLSRDSIQNTLIMKRNTNTATNNQMNRALNHYYNNGKVNNPEVSA